MEFFEVGGCVRDEIMGKQSKDIDFSVVLTEQDMADHKTKKGATRTPFEVMEFELKRRGFEIFVRSPEFLTIRARFPKGLTHGMLHFEHKGLTADFVLARKESDYTDGRRPDTVEIGSLLDDLARRDFTMNAIAKDIDGNLIDPFDGQRDIADRIIRCVGSPQERLTEDALRGLRALRFSVTKGFRISRDIQEFMATDEFATMLQSVSKERQREEMEKMFSHDTFQAFKAMQAFPSVCAVVFSNGLRLSATMKK